MKKYRITFYDGWSVWATQIGREYIYFHSEEDARRYATDRIKGHEWGFDVATVSFSEII